MEKFKVAAVQMNALKGDLDHNLAVHERFTRQAASEGCALVMFPELSATAHFGDVAAADLSQPVDKGRVHDTMLALARETGIVISYGLCEEAHGTMYNSQVLIGEKGVIGVQRKVHASSDEYFYFRMGRSFEVFDLGFCTVGTLICYDVTFFESWRVMALKGADVLLLPHAARSGRNQERTREEQLEQIRKELDGAPGRNGVFGADNGVFGVFANQYGYNGHSTHGGGAYIFGPDGKLITKGEPLLEDLMITAELDPAVQHASRARGNHPMKTRRPEVYGEITRMV